MALRTCIELLLLPTLIFLGGARFTSGELVDVSVLLPLTGSEQVKGLAQKIGIEIAIDEFLQSRNLSTLPFEFTFHNTQCETSSENKVVLQQLLNTSRRLLVLGGGCLVDEPLEVVLTPPVSAFTDLAPQVAFDGLLPVGDSAENFATVAPSLANLHQPLTNFILQNQWDRVALLHSTTAPYLLGAEALSEKLHHAGVKLELHLENTHPQRFALLKTSRLRIVILYMDISEAVVTLCDSQIHDVTNDRFIWLIPTTRIQTVLSNSPLATSTSLSSPSSSPSSSSSSCQINSIQHLHFFYISEDSFQSLPAFDLFQEEVRKKDPDLPSLMYGHAAHAHDATLVAFSAISRVSGETSQSYESFARAVTSVVKSTTIDGATGLVSFNSDGTRQEAISIYTIQGGEMTAYTPTVPARLESDVVEVEMQFVGVSLSVLIIFSSLTFIGITYAIAILAYNLRKRKHRLIKMTSPNLNVVIIFGAILGYLAVLMPAFDSQHMLLHITAACVQTSAYFVATAFSLIYGSMFVKSWRVFLIFKNLNFNGKTTRDEHLLLGISVFLIVDLIILVTWSVVDPIVCSRHVVYTTYQSSQWTDLIYESDICTSELIILWILLLYVIKLPVLVIGGYLTYQIRHVTLPSLKDSREIYVIVFSVGVAALVVLPALMTDRVGMGLKYPTLALLTWIVITTTLTLLFIPKFLMVRKEKESPVPNDAIKFLFSESMKKTQEQSYGRCSLCCCLLSEDEDKYAQEVLANEIETLTKTIKEKDVTIRELNDRLYFGAERFQEYLTSPKRRKYLTESEIVKAHTRRTMSQPIYSRGAPRSLKKMNSERAHYAENGNHEFTQKCRENDNYDSHLKRETNINNEMMSPTRELSVRHLADDMNTRMYHPKLVRAATVGNSASTQARKNHLNLARHASEDLHIQDKISWASDCPTSLRVSSLPITQRNLQEMEAQRPTKLPRSPSPNHDSAIDNNSPSSGSSDDRDSYEARPSELYELGKFGGEMKHLGSPRRFEAIAEVGEVLGSKSRWPPTPTIENPAYMPVASGAFGDRDETEDKYYSCDSVAVSEI